MSRACTSASLGVARRGVESFKSAKRDHLSLLEEALAYELPFIAEPYYAPTSFPYSYLALPESVTEDLAWCFEKSVRNDDIASEIDSIVDSSPSPPPQTPLKRQRATSSAPSCVHKRALDDSHYPFNVQRKSHTKMRSGVCVWCGAQALMSLPDRPRLRTRTSGSDSDWERWMRELASPRSAFLRHLADTLMPMHQVLRIIKPDQLADFYREMAGALIETALREHRREHHRDLVDERAIMTQVRSSKYHKTTRIAKIIEAFYEQANESLI